MKIGLFIAKFLAFIVSLFFSCVIILFVIPKDNNSYLCEYNHKLKLLETVELPRIIIIGGSSVAFGTDSKQLADSLKCNVINFGLHGGIGIRYPVEDAIRYIKDGDLVVLQFEYINFFDGGGGEPETFTQFMMATNWRNFISLDYDQKKNAISGVPLECILSIKRLCKFFFIGSFDKPSVNSNFAYVKSGFNEFGDEVSHLNYPIMKYTPSNKLNKSEVRSDFVEWLKETIHIYEKKGAKVIMLPPVCINSHFKSSYNDNIEKALININYPYVTKPSQMALDDSCVFNTGYHVNSYGVRQNTNKIINTLKLLR